MMLRYGLWAIAAAWFFSFFSCSHSVVDLLLCLVSSSCCVGHFQPRFRLISDNVTLGADRSLGCSDYTTCCLLIGSLAVVFLFTLHDWLLTCSQTLRDLTMAQLLGRSVKPSFVNKTTLHETQVDYLKIVHRRKQTVQAVCALICSEHKQNTKNFSKRMNWHTWVAEIVCTACCIVVGCVSLCGFLLWDSLHHDALLLAAASTGMSLF